MLDFDTLVFLASHFKLRFDLLIPEERRLDDKELMLKSEMAFDDLDSYIGCLVDIAKHRPLPF